MATRTEDAARALNALGELLNTLNEADGLWAQANTGSVWYHTEAAFKAALRLYVGPSAAQSVWEMWLDNNSEPVTDLVAEFERSIAGVDVR